MKKKQSSLFLNLFKTTRRKEEKASKIQNEIANNEGYKTYFHDVGKPVWTSRNYNKFADEAYTRNVIAYRSISMIAKTISSVPLKLYDRSAGLKTEIKNHEIIDILNFPNPLTNGKLFIESLASYRIISGNAYILAVHNGNGKPAELYALRPDRVSIISDRSGFTTGYLYSSNGKETRYNCNKITGRSNILHLKNFHPLDDHYGLSPVEAAAYSIDQHNQAAQWNQALLQNGAKPSGALVVKSEKEGGMGILSEEQYSRIKSQIEEQFTGTNNAGRPILLEGGMDWKELSLSPKDMDYIECKNIAAREIALAFGIPPQLLGIQGDNTYANLSEARLSFWEQTILPMMDELCNALNHWLVPMYEAQESLHLTYDTNNIEALNIKREKLWDRVSKADFLTFDEKREMVGL
ncbi:MAG TPA: phage portal protein [Alphaproteobacteria bacterium]|nr:phage portal protein [Alphaproteobacteria bacterium]